MSNTKASSRCSKRLPWHWRLNRSILRGAVRKHDFHKKLERLSVQAGQMDKILAAHVQRICEVHDTVIQSYYQRIQESSGADATTSMENLGEKAYVQITHNPVVISCWRKVKTKRSLSKMSKPLALHAEGTAHVSEWINISDTAKKLY